MLLSCLVILSSCVRMTKMASELPLIVLHHKLTLHHGSSALAISQAPIKDLPTILSYSQEFTINAAPGTDLWRKPPAVDIDNAPTLLINDPIDLHRFHTARVTVSAPWNTLYDQGGLALFIPDEDTKKFLKTGVEFAFGEPHVGTVAASRWGDWSLVPTPATGKVTIQVERELDKDGKRTSSLWVYLVDPDTGKKSGIREITWWFRHDMEDDALKQTHPSDRQVLLVGLYAARPTVPEGVGREKEELVVKFEGFEVTLFDDQMSCPASLALASLTQSQLTFIENLPKAELHAHLNGSIPIQVLQDLAIEYTSNANNTLPNDTVLAGIQKLLDGVSLDAIEDFFGLFPAIYALTSTPDALAKATRAVLSTFLSPKPDPKSRDHHPLKPQCTYLELRTTPRSTPFMSRELYLRTVLSQTSTYPPKTIGIIASLDRRMSRSDMREVVDSVIKLKKEGQEGIVGVDLCGDPTVGDVEECREFFEEVKKAGLGVTVHIAETTRNSEEETTKLLSFNPDRLGHATFLNEQARKVVLEKKMCIEICLTSNLLCKTVPVLDSHHIRYYLHHQHPVAICTDDVLPFRTSLTAEYALLLAQAPLGLGLTQGEVEKIAEMSMNSRFLK